MFKKKGNYYVNRHSCFLLQYHMVLVTKYRHPVLTGEVKELVYDIIRDICEERKCNVISINGEPDHIHLLFEAMPQLCPAEFVNVIKTKTARFARRDYPEQVSRYYWKRLFWSDSYFIATVSERSMSAVKEYINNQQG